MGPARPSKGEGAHDGHRRDRGRCPTNYQGLIVAGCSVVIFATVPLVLLQWSTDLTAWRFSSDLLFGLLMGLRSFANLLRGDPDEPE